MRFMLVLLAIAMPALAAEPTPEITRTPATAQAVGVAHTVRTIPEACARIEGVFTGSPAQPYALAVVRTSARCQPRARFVDEAQAQPSEAAGWKLNDLVRVPDASCGTRFAVVRVWRKPATAALPGPDAQGQARIYLDEQRAAAAANALAAIPLFAAQMHVEGQPCGG